MDFGLDSQTGLPFTVDLHGFSERALGQKGNMGRDFIDVSRQDLLHNGVPNTNKNTGPNTNTNTGTNTETFFTSHARFDNKGVL